jgi:MYXO-CTERM domain-containing protein
MRVLAAALLLFLWPAGRALACTCVQQTPEEAYARASAVFEGRVVGVVPPAAGDVGGGGRVRVTFRVTQAWKGVEHEQVTVWTTASSATCGYGFEEGRVYLVYASGDAAQSSTGLCSGTKPIGEAADEIAALGAGVTPVDVTDTEPRTAAPRARAGHGCGSCSVADRGGAAGGLAVAIAILGVITRRRTS